MISVMLISACRLTAAGLVAYLLLWTLEVTPPAGASHAGGADAFSIDMNPFGPSANSATTLGTRQTCAGIKVNGVQDADEDGIDTVTVDVTAGQIPASTAIVGFQFILLHNDAALTVLNYNLAFLLGATPGSQIADVSEPTPDDWINGRWGAAAVDMGPGAYSESGSGVLARVTLAPDAGAGGLYDLALAASDSFHVNDQAAAYYPDVLNNAQLLAGGYCTDSDADGVFDVDEVACGGNANSASLRPERTDGAFATTDDDGDTLVNEPLPTGSETYDCDGDGWKGNEENLIYSVAPSTISDQDPCGNNGWPGDLTGDNKINIGDINSFLTPTRPVNDGHGTFNKFSHPLDDTVPFGSVIDPPMARWNLQLPPHTPTTLINIGDYNSLISGIFGSGAFPPMFGGQQSFGKTCPWPA